MPSRKSPRRKPARSRAAPTRPRSRNPPTARPGSFRARHEELQRREQRRNHALIGLVAAIAVALAVVALVVGASGSSTAPSAPPKVLLASAGHPSGQPIDGIPCQTREQLVVHTHAHLAVYVAARPRYIPAGIGIRGARFQGTGSGAVVRSGSCFYWLHAHTPDGIIHVESPGPQAFTLGQYFDLWGQPLDAGQVGPARGPVTAYVDGKRWNTNPRQIPLSRHTVIQLDVGTNVAPAVFNFPPGL